MKIMRMGSATAMRKIRWHGRPARESRARYAYHLCLLIPLVLFSAPAFAQSPPAKILYVGAISINPCQDAKVLADWYSRFGIETREYHGGYYGKLDTAAGLFAFGIHPKKADAPKQCAPSVSVVYRVENFESSLAAMKSKGLVPDKIEKDPNEGQFAHFHDPDGNEVTIWEGKK